MILTCPNCNSQFKVALAAFGTEGRNVKCSSCKETWLQEPEDNDYADRYQGSSDDDQEQEAAAVDVQDVDDIEEEDDFSEAIQAIENSMSEDEIQEKRQVFRKAYAEKEGRILAYASAGVVFILILLYLLLNSNSIMKSNPGMQGFYKFFGIHMVLPDSDVLAFEGVKAERDGGVVIASGRIVNLSLEEWRVPMMEITVISPPQHEGGEEEILGQWVVSPPEPVLGAEKELHFEYMQYLEAHEEPKQDTESDEHKADEKHDDPHAKAKAEEHGAEDAGHEDDKHVEPAHVEEEELEEEPSVFVRIRFVIVPSNDDANPSHDEEGEPSEEGGEEKHKEEAKANGGHEEDPQSKDLHEPPANH